MRIEFEHRPLLLFCLALTFGIIAAHVPWFALALAGILWVKLTRSRALIASGFAIGLLLSPPPVHPPVLEREYFSGVVRVTKPTEVRGETRRATLADHRGRVFFLYASPQDELSLGDRLQVSGVIRPHREGNGWAEGRGIVGKLEPTRMERIESGPALYRLGLSWRESFLTYCQATLRPEAAAAVGALCFNAGGALESETMRNLQRSGTIHIISASGLHVVIFAFGVSGLLAMLPVPRWFQLGLLMLVLLLYATATGLQPPVVRSIIMAGVLLGAYIFKREADMLSSLAAAALLYLLIEPASLFEPSFQLSFLTVAAFGLFLAPSDPPEDVKGKLLHNARLVATASLVATIASAPVVAYYFGSFSVVAVIANLLLAPVLMPLTLTAIAALGVGIVWPGLADFAMAWVVEPLTGWILLVVNLLGPLPFAALEVPPFEAWWLIPVYSGFLLTWRKRLRPSI